MAAASVDGPRVFVQRTAKAPKRTAIFKRAVLDALARAAPDVQGDVTLVLTGDAAVRRLNRRYRGSDRTTDVLSFELSSGDQPGEPFGDIIVSVDAARRQARAYGVTAHDEILRLIVHGALHLCGHDHHERRAAARMHGLTRRLLKRLRAGA